MNLSQELLNRCRKILLECDEFTDHASLKALFQSEKLSIYKHRLPKGRHPSDQVNQIIGFLLPRKLSSGEPVFPIFIAALRDNQIEGDVLHDNLVELYHELDGEIAKQFEDALADSSSSDMLSFAQKIELVERLLAIPSIADRARRVIVIQALRSEIKTNVVDNSADKTHVFNMVNTCLQYSGGMQELRDRLQSFEGDSIPMQRFKEAFNRLLPRG